ncbi:MAG TPA: Lrp/AsnC family transcriptional regulator [Blastocatellia bacterium]|nr:Lrp/AsnC family transcriptional regulator [Blastocatellia bacterium]
MIDEIDKRILKIIQNNARTPNSEIARQVGMAPSAILERLRRLEERGVIRGYRTQLDARKLGLGLTAFVFVRTDDFTSEGEAAVQLGEIPEVLEVHHIAGEDCFLIKVRAADTEALGRLLRERIGAIKSVRSTRTTIVLQTAKETNELPICATGTRDEER